MQIIAESGGSKTDWRLLYSDGTIQQIASSGLNPTYTTNDQLLELLKKEVEIELTEELEVIYFYGAGCHKKSQKERIKNVLESFFPSAKSIFVYHDLLAAARSTSSTDQGIVCILGTGSNACYYNGETIEEEMVNLGYILGDEGSGAHFGKILLKSYFEKALPLDISNNFLNRFPDLDRGKLIDQLYIQDKPNKFLASFFPFIIEHQAHPYMHNMLLGGFEEFLRKVKSTFKNANEIPVHFVGGVAFHSNNILRRALQNQQLIAGTIIESPIAGLTLYHKNLKL